MIAGGACEGLVLQTLSVAGSLEALTGSQMLWVQTLCKLLYPKRAALYWGLRAAKASST